MQHFERTLHCPYIATLRRHYGSNEREVIYPGFAPHIAHHISEHARMDFGPGSSWITSRSGCAKDFWGDMPSQIIPGVCSSFFQTILPFSSQTVEKRKIWLIVKPAS